MTYEIVVIQWCDGATIHRFDNILDYLSTQKWYAEHAHPNNIIQSYVYPQGGMKP